MNTGIIKHDKTVGVQLDKIGFIEAWLSSEVNPKKMLPILIHLVTVAAAVDVTPSLSIPVPRSSFMPSYIVYTKHAAVNEDKLTITNMNLTTSIPTLRLDNFPFAIKSISCSPQNITISFYDQVVCAEAFGIWSDFEGLAFLIGHEQGCNGNDEGTIVVYDIRIDKNNTDIIADYD